ncbi:MFS transporter [Planctomicrobium sp. SH664]|uniref:MFS transporter n=1 Tax=Planctomicrobium sp. SH664 TaxID=3448125 RepID=UPI003F5C4122
MLFQDDKVAEPAAADEVLRDDIRSVRMSAPEPDLAQARPTTVRYRVIAWLSMASFLAYLCRNALGVAESRIREDLGLTLTQSGHFMAAFFWTYALFQVPTGAFSHRYGTRVAMTIFVVAWSLSMFATANSPVFWMLIITQFVMGTAQAGFFPAATNSMKYWMPMSRRSLAGALLGVGMQSGAIVSGIVTGELLGYMSWRWVFMLLSIPGIVWAVAFYIRFRDRPEQCPEVNTAERELILAGRPSEQVAASQKETGPTDWKAILRHRGLWMLYGQQICRAAGYMFFASWFPTFLQQTRGVSIAQSGYMQGIIFAGAMTGSIVGGLLIDWIWKRTGNLQLSRCGIGAAALGTCGLLILGSWFVEDARIAIGLLAVGVMCASLAGPAMFSTVIDISGARVAQVLGAVNMAGNLAVAACPILVGKLFELTENWNLVLLLFAGIYLTGAACWAFVNPRVGIFKTETSPAVS